MTRDSDITPYSDSVSGTSSPPASKSARMRRVATALKWSGLAGFWIQIFLGIVSALTLAATIINEKERSSPGVGFGLFCAVCGLICLVVGICISFRYSKMAPKFNRINVAPPKKSTTIKIVQVAIITSLVGTLLTIFGAQTIAGIVLSKTLSLDPGEIFNSQRNTGFVNSLDIFIILACINIIAGHFVGIVSSLWIYSQIDR